VLGSEKALSPPVPLFARLRQSGSALGAWGSDRAPLRVVVVRWLLLVLGLAALALVWRGPRADNLARHAQITMSSNCGAVPIYSRGPVEPARLVDGKTDRNYDACTTAEREPWLLFDLGKRAALDRVVISGRADCCWGTGTLPLLLELSEDGHDYELVRRRRVPFTRDSPWRTNLGHKTARYLRLRVEPGSELSEIVLSEVEIYGAAL
jgi:hypothetical protein